MWNDVCLHNGAIVCQEKNNCARCGWYPREDARRKAQLRKMFTRKVKVKK